MIIVATQDDYLGEKWCIWNTVTDEFLGVNLSKEETIKVIMEYKGNYTYEEALSRVENAQPFSDIAKIHCHYPDIGFLKHFLAMEITESRKRIKKEEDYCICYDGVEVGNKKARNLFENHINFCKEILQKTFDLSEEELEEMINEER